MATLTDAQIESLKSTARQELRQDDEDFCVNDYAGGNMDDAFGLGVSEGNIEQARQVLTWLGISWAE